MKLKAICLFFLAAAAVGCGGAGTQAPKSDKIKIGFAMDTLKEERWVRDKKAFEARCVEMKVECVITVANNIADRQANDVDNL